MEDIFTEPTNVSAETLANLGPLSRLAGVWEGQRGVDVNPKADGPEQRSYYERIEMQRVGDLAARSLHDVDARILKAVRREPLL